MATPDFQVSGFKETKNLLQELPQRTQKRGLRQAINAAATPVVRAARAKAPRGDTGLLKKSLVKKVKTYQDGNVAAVIGSNKAVQGTIQTPRGERKHVPARILHLVAKGVRPHDQPKLGQHHPGAAPNPFLKDAYQANRKLVEVVASNKLAKFVESEAQKLGKK